MILVSDCHQPEAWERPYRTSHLCTLRPDSSTPDQAKQHIYINKQWAIIGKPFFFFFKSSLAYLKNEEYLADQWESISPPHFSRHLSSQHHTAQSVFCQQGVVQTLLQQTDRVTTVNSTNKTQLALNICLLTLLRLTVCVPLTSKRWIAPVLHRSTYRPAGHSVQSS